MCVNAAAAIAFMWYHGEGEMKKRKRAFCASFFPHIHVYVRE